MKLCIRDSRTAFLILIITVSGNKSVPGMVEHIQESNRQRQSGTENSGNHHLVIGCADRRLSLIHILCIPTRRHRLCMGRWSRPVSVSLSVPRQSVLSLIHICSVRAFFSLRFWAVVGIATVRQISPNRISSVSYTHLRMLRRRRDPTSWAGYRNIVSVSRTDCCTSGLPCSWQMCIRDRIVTVFLPTVALNSRYSSDLAISGT